jgi:VRR-NUC domain
MPTVKEIIPTEDEEQTKLAIWLTKQAIRFYAIPNGGRRSLREAIKLKRTGVSPGVPDICVPIPSGGYHGLYIELKRQRGGRVSNEQTRWLQFLRDKGYWADVAFGFEEAKDIVIHYLALTRPAA